MKLTPNSNMDFYSGGPPQPLYNPHVVSFQTKRMIPGQNSSLGPSSSGAPTRTADSSSSVYLAGEPATNNVILGHVPGLRCNPGLSTEWTSEEEAILNDGLVKYAKNLNMTKYVKIAAALHHKTVRDVALRCKWINKENVKRRKTEELHVGKKMNDRKENMTDFSPNAINNILPPYTIPVYSEEMHTRGPILDSATQHLLEENTQVISQISANLEAMQIEDNPALLLLMRNNIVLIQNRMKQMPGMMSLMPPLPESMDDGLTASLLLCTNH